VTSREEKDHLLSDLSILLSLPKEVQVKKRSIFKEKECSRDKSRLA